MPFISFFSVDNKNLRDRFGIQGFPTFYYIQDGKLYSYKGQRTVEAWTEFAETGYKTAEVEEVPTEASAMKNFMKQAKRIFDEIKTLATNKPYVFGAVVGGLVLMCALTFWCTSKLAGEEQPPRTAPETTEATGQASDQTEPSLDTKKRDSSESKRKVKRE